MYHANHYDVDCERAMSIIRARSPSEISYTRSRIDQPAETSQTFRLKKNFKISRSLHYNHIRFHTNDVIYHFKYYIYTYIFVNILCFIIIFLWKSPLIIISKNIFKEYTISFISFIASLCVKLMFLSFIETFVISIIEINSLEENFKWQRLIEK